MKIHTERLILRGMESRDKAGLFEIMSDEETCLNGGGFHAFTEPDEEFDYLFENFLTQNRYSIIEKNTEKMVGLIKVEEEGNRAVRTEEIGFDIHPACRRRGYAFEAVSGLIGTYFQKTSVEMFTAAHFPGNIPSKRLLEKLGFRYEGRRHNALYHDTLGPIDLMCYYLEKPEIGRAHV